MLILAWTHWMTWYTWISKIVRLSDGKCILGKFDNSNVAMMNLEQHQQNTIEFIPIYIRR